MFRLFKASSQSFSVRISKKYNTLVEINRKNSLIIVMRFSYFKVPKQDDGNFLALTKHFSL